MRVNDIYMRVARNQLQELVMSMADEIALRLGKAGIGEPAIAAMQKIDALLQVWRRRVARRELGQHALADLGIDLDLAALDVLFAIQGAGPEGGEAEETTVGAVAERLGIDPSRASRIVGEMVDRGYARRGVSQADARRAVVTLSPRGVGVVASVMEYKALLMGDFLSEWTQEELAAFLPLLERFSAWSDETGTRRGRFAAEIADIASRLRETEPA
jgi:DNA-binding MarR family transcriptional regulator